MYTYYRRKKKKLVFDFFDISIKNSQLSDSIIRPSSSQSSNQTISKTLTTTDIKNNIKFRTGSNTIELGTLSIKDSVNKIEEDLIQRNRNEKSEFTYEELHYEWENYIKILDKQDLSQSLVSALRSYKFSLSDDYVINLPVENSMLSSLIDSNKELILDFLKNKLNNFYITLETSVIDDINKDKVAYSNREIYEELLKINPKLEYLNMKFLFEF